MKKIIALSALLALAPLSAQAASGFCAVKITSTTAVVTVPKDTESKQALEADFEALLKAGTIDYGDQPLTGIVQTRPFKGCLVFDDSETALSAMKGKMLEIQKALGLEIRITGW